MRGKLSELPCNVLLFSNRGEKVMKCRKTMGHICVLYFLVFGHSPRNWRKTEHKIVVVRVFHAGWNICCVWKIVGTTFKCIVVLQSRTDCPKTFMEPGSESATYALHFLTLLAPFVFNWRFQWRKFKLKICFWEEWLIYKIILNLYMQMQM